MPAQPDDPLSLTRRQSAGCFAIAALGLAAAVLCLVLGWRCTQTTMTFNCLGLLTVFPAVFIAVALVALAIGWRRFVRAEPVIGARRQVSFGATWQTVEPPRRDGVIELPGRSSAGGERDGDEGKRK
jgi:hypothetical protein